MSTENDQTISAIPVADCNCNKDGAQTVEVVALHLYHSPDDELDVNGFTYVLRLGDQEFTIGAREGVDGLGEEPKPAVPFPTGGEQYISLITQREELLGSVQNNVAEIAPQILRLFADLKAAKTLNRLWPLDSPPPAKAIIHDTKIKETN